MRVESRKYLYDIQRAVELLRELIQQRHFQIMRPMPCCVQQLNAEFEIVGEAMTQLAKADKAVVSRISKYRRFIAFRNVLIHGYAHVDDRLVWDVVETNLSTLSSEIEVLLGE